MPSVAPYFSGILELSAYDSPLIYSGKPVNFLTVRNSDGKSKSVCERGEKRVPPRGFHCVETLGCSKGLLCAFILRREEQHHIPFKEE